MWVGTFLRQRPQLCQACWPPSVLFSQRGPSEGSRRGHWARQAYFWNLCLAGVLRRGPEDLLVALRGVAGVWARVSASGYGLALALAGTLRGEFKLLPSPWEHVSNSGALHVLLQLWTWQWLGCPLPPDTETWGGGCWGILNWLQRRLHSGEARWAGQHNLQRTLDPLGAQRAAGPPALPAVSWGWPSRTAVALS